MTAKCACNCAMPSDSESMKYCPMTMDWKIHLLQFPLSQNHTLCHFKHLNVSMRTMPKTEIKPCSNPVHGKIVGTGGRNSYATSYGICNFPLIIVKIRTYRN
ncbi:uncharacterized protein LOC120348367 [Styela clava]